MEMTSYKKNPHENVVDNFLLVKIFTTDPEKVKTVKSRHGLCSCSLGVFRHGVRQTEK